MRLINIHTLQIQNFVGDPPPYAILSHRWIGEETTYEDFINESRRHGPGFEKVRRFCEFVRDFDEDELNDPPSWVWVDTCCIDKRSSAELSEAINSMAQWYRRSQLCVAYLNDVTATADLASSEWFCRGWTLQELLFPKQIFLCGKDWNILRTSEGTDLLPKFDDIIVEITRIPKNCLQFDILIYEESIAARMSWMANRKTTRAEDIAYCLLGLFGVNLPLLYGEGINAFARLQQEIIRQWADESIFAWTGGMSREQGQRLIHGILASHPKEFTHCNEVVSRPMELRIPYKITNRGFEITTKAVKVERAEIKSAWVYFIQLNCCWISRGHSEDTVIERACLLAIEPYESGYIRSHPWLTSEELWSRFVLNSDPPQEVSEVDLQTYYIRLSTNFSYAPPSSTDIVGPRPGSVTLDRLFSDWQRRIGSSNHRRG